jgi:hypothetical protein
MIWIPVVIQSTNKFQELKFPLPHNGCHLITENVAATKNTNRKM